METSIRARISAAMRGLSSSPSIASATVSAAGAAWPVAILSKTASSSARGTASAPRGARRPYGVPLRTRGRSKRAASDSTAVFPGRMNSAPRSTTLPANGTDQTLPPTRSRASSTVTSMPAARNSSAAASPANPAPTTTTLDVTSSASARRTARSPGVHRNGSRPRSCGQRRRLRARAPASVGNIRGGLCQGTADATPTLGLEHRKCLDLGGLIAEVPCRRTFVERHHGVADELTAALGDQQRVALAAQPVLVLGPAVLPESSRERTGGIAGSVT